MKLKNNHRKRNEKIVITWRLVIYVTKIPVISDEIKGNLKYLETSDNKNTTTKFMSCSKSSS